MAEYKLEDLAKLYKKELESNPTTDTAQKVADEINGLKYTNTGKSISTEDKQKIVNKMSEQVPIMESADNTSILDLIALVKNLTVGEKK